MTTPASGPCNSHRRSPIRCLATIVAAFAVLILLLPAPSDSSRGDMPKHWSARLSTPRGWYAAALCIHSREGAWNAATRNGYEGGMQFLHSTWTSVGGHTHGRHWASVESPKEQLWRSFLVWRRDGGSFREWGTARACGV